MTASARLKRRVSRLQEKFVLLINGIKCNQSTVYTYVGQTAIETRQHMRFCFLIRNALVNRQPKMLADLLKIVEGGRTRSSSSIRLERPQRSKANLRCADDLFSERACDAWNVLDDSIRKPDVVFNKNFSLLFYRYCSETANHRLK
jgi:hypothetical protein